MRISDERIVGICGHEVPDVGAAFCVRVATRERDGRPAVFYDVACLPCQEVMRATGSLLDGRDAVQRWLDGPLTPVAQ